jgi:Raf kinase inhibitor-like YbhB/YbcL family protein
VPYPLAVITLAALSATALTSAVAQGAPPVSLTLTSPAFAAGTEIPTRYTCEGADLSPPLAWTAPPDGTRSLALVIDDPDAPDPAAPKVTWVHWVLYGLPPAEGSLPEGAGRDALPAGAREGLNDWRRPGYGGPCPPVGRHRYFFKLYALDAVLADRKRCLSVTLRSS